MAEVSEVVKDKVDDSGKDETRTKAAAQGWADKEFWKGDPKDWVDAETFLKRGEDWLTDVKKRNDVLAKDLSLTKQQLKELREATDEFKKFQKEAYERKVTDLETQLAAIKKERAQAITDGDGNKVNELDDVLDATKDKIKEAKASSAEAAKPTKVTQAPQEVDKDLQEWLDENEWFGRDRRMTAITNGIGESLRIEFPDLKGKEFLAKMNDILEEEFPSKFGKKNNRASSPVESGSGSRGSRPSRDAHTYDNLPDDAKKACDKFVSTKLMTREQYVQEYDWS